MAQQCWSILIWLLLALLWFSGSAVAEEAKPLPKSGTNEESTKSALSNYAPGEGFDVAKGRLGSLNISAYVLLRFIDQLPATQSFVDHLGNTHPVDTRRDIQLHRILLHFSGFLFTEKLQQDTTVWAVNSTNSVTAIASLNYKFAKEFTLGGGIGALPGTRSMNYEHPFFLGTDRQMADEFFRPSFTSGVWASGKPVSKLQYRVMLGNNLNMVDVNAGQITRDLAYGGTLAWLPTTGEFGPRGGFGDFEMHDELATRFGVSTAHSREDRFTEINNPYPDNTTIRLSDSLALFQTGALAPGVTLQKANYLLISSDASMKYQGFFLFGEGYFRFLNEFDTGGAQKAPIDSIRDTGFMLQSSYMLIPQQWEAYLAHSQLYGAFNRAWELTFGANYYPYKSRTLKLNGSVTYVDRSPVNSLFGYFVGGQKGPTIALSTDFTF
jgi:hypothetical protein